MRCRVVGQARVERWCVKGRYESEPQATIRLLTGKDKWEREEGKVAV